MRRFIFQLLFFLIPILIFAVIGDFFISKELMKSHRPPDEYSVWNDIYDGKIDSKIAIYGSSRAWVQIDPQIISDSLHMPAYNFGIDGHNFWLQYLRHTIFLNNNNKRPQLIIYSLDVFTLQKRDDLYNSDQFLPYMFFNNQIRTATLDYKGFNVFDFFLPLVRYYGRKRALFQALNVFLNHQKDSIIRIKGYQGQNASWNSDLSNAKKGMESYEIKLDTPTIKLFKTYLQECKSKNIKIIFVYSPEYIDGQKFVKNRGAVIDLYENLSKKYDIPFYDYSTDSMSYQKKYFYNAEHLNKSGSEIFTNKLVKELKLMKVGSM